MAIIGLKRIVRQVKRAWLFQLSRAPADSSMILSIGECEFAVCQERIPERLA